VHELKLSTPMKSIKTCALAFSTASHFEGHSLYANIRGLSHANYNLQRPVYLSGSEI